MNKIKAISLSAALLIGVAFTAKPILNDIKATAAAYVYSYPLVMMDETQKSDPINNVFNSFTHGQVYPDADFRAVVRANVDTLYSTAWIDLANEPVIVNMPDTQGRYIVLPFMDAWTNVFARVGSSTTGTHAQSTLVIGPDFKGDIPSGFDNIIKSPTNMVWLITRIKSLGKDDIPAIAKLQDGLTISTFSQWKNKTLPPHRVITNPSQMSVAKAPIDVLDNMDAQTFFSRANALMAKQPPLPADGPELAKFAHLNISPGTQFDFKKLSWLQQKILPFAVNLAKQKLVSAVESGNFDEHGWSDFPMELGNFGTNYPLRCVVAQFGLGALSTNEAYYPTVKHSLDGEILDGSKHNYTLHFKAGELPPVDAFWSLTLYNQASFMTHNAINRYSVSDRSNFDFNQDGSLDIYIQHSQPEQGTNNWLPAPKEVFDITLRLYRPKPSIIDGSWLAPAMIKNKI